MLARSELDVRVLITCAACTLGMGLLIGIAPAILATRVDPDGVLRAGAAARGMRSAARTRQALVVMELAVAMMLVVGASLMAASLWRLARIDLGFQPENVLTFRLQPSSGQVSDPTQADSYFRHITARLAAVPGVVSVGAVQHLPLSGFNWSGNLDIESKPMPATLAHPRVTWRSVTGDYFGAMRIPLLRGREFTTADRRDAPPVVIINDAMARQFWPAADPLGQRIKLGNGTRNEWATVVGIVGDVRFNSPDTPPAPEAYRPNAQQALAFMHYVVRSRRSPLAFVPEIRTAVRSLDSTVPIAEVRALDELVASSVKTRRSVALLLSSFAALGLVLGAVGIYGVISFGVSQRTREIGIRSALGARRRAILGAILGEGVRLAATGTALGAIGALIGTRSLRSLVYGVGTAEPAVYAFVAGVLGIVAIAATLIPARRAARIDPVIALRGE